MRTAPHSILSVSPEAQSKSVKTPISSKVEGRVFADDFSDAKAVLAPKQTSLSGQSPASQSSNPVKHDVSVIDPESKVTKAVNSDVKATSSEHSLSTVETVAGNNQAVFKAESGKGLQPIGVESPVDSPALDDRLPSSQITSQLNGALVSEGMIADSSLKGQANTFSSDVQTTPLMPSSVSIPVDEAVKPKNLSLMGDLSEQAEPILTTATLSSNNSNTDSSTADTEANSLLFASDTAKGALASGIAGEVPTALPLQTEVEKGVKEAQLAVSSSGSLVADDLDNAPIKKSHLSSGSPVVIAGAAGLALSQAELTPVNSDLKTMQAELASNDFTSMSALQQGAKELIDASSVDSAQNIAGELASEIPAEGVAEASGAGVLSVGALGVVALGAVGDKQTASKTSSVSLDEKSNIRLESTALDDDLNITDDGELSWVLSQMKPPITNDVASAVMTAAVAPPMVAGDKRQQANQPSALGLPEGVKGLNVEKMPPAFLNEGISQSAGSDHDSKFTDMIGEDGVLLNEPVELRKKEQDAMIGRMSAQFDGSGAKGDLDTGGMNSSINNNHVNRPALGAGAATLAAANSGQTNLAMNLPPNHPGWANEMSQKVAWVARDGGHTAHIRLDPPELGSLTVKVSVDQDSNTQVSFVAATPQARDLLEGQMSRLRDMLAQQGMDLSHVDVDVSQQDTSGAQYGESAGRNTGTSRAEVLSQEGDDDLPLSHVSYSSAAGIDYYA